MISRIRRARLSSLGQNASLKTAPFPSFLLIAAGLPSKRGSSFLNLAMISASGWIP